MSKKKKHIEPDDYFKRGPIEIARFGKFVHISSNWSKEEFEKQQTYLKEQLPKTISKLDTLVVKISGAIKKYHPLGLMHRAYWEMSHEHLCYQGEDEPFFETSETKKSVHSVLVLEYIQNVIAATSPDETCSHVEPTEEDWLKLKNDIQKLYDTLNLNYLICESATAKGSDNVAVSQIRHQAITHWINVRGERYTSLEITHLEDLLYNHRDSIKQTLGITPEILIAEISKIIHALTRGIGQAVEELADIRYQHFNPETLKNLQSDKSDDASALNADKFREALSELGIEKQVADATDRFFGFGLFDLQKISDLPITVLEYLSWNLGEDTSFLDGREQSGWPTRITPITKRPFLKIDGKFYCFNLYGLLDNFYRTVQRLVISIDSSLQNKWENIQKESTEALPLKYLERMLPGARCFKDLYYKHYPNDSVKKKYWCETDGLVVYGDVLLIVEVKAGAFTYTSPIDDFDAYVESIRNLVEKPAKQGARLVDYIKSAEKVSFYDKDKISEIVEIRGDDFRSIFICAVTVDSFTEIASRIQQLKPLGLELGQYPLWSISIDDLRVCADIFHSPLIFLHYLENRMLAYSNPKVGTVDELDHIGLYFQHNNYSKYTDELNLDSKSFLQFNGYREPVDQFFHQKLLGEAPEPLIQQGIPERLKQIIDFCSGAPRRNARLASFILDADAETRTMLSESIDTLLSKQAARRRVQMFSTTGEYRLSIACWQPHLFTPDSEFAHNYAMANILDQDEEDRMLLQLIFDPENILSGLAWSHVNKDDIPEHRKAELLNFQRITKEKRISAAKSKQGKIGRNEKCPCGSGKKYKKCCLA